MYVNLVFFIAIFQCVLSRDNEDLHIIYSPAWPGNLNEGHRAQIVNFENTPTNGYIVSQNPQLINGVLITGQTGYHGIPPNFHTIPQNWNSHPHHYEQHQVGLPNNNLYHQQNPVYTPIKNTNAFPSQSFHQTPPNPIRLQIPDNTGKINVESLQGKFEDFIKPDSSHPEHVITYGRPDQGYNQGGAQFHDTTSPVDLDPFAPLNKNVPEATTTLPVTNAQVTTVTPAGYQQENDNSNSDVLYDIDIRKDTV